MALVDTLKAARQRLRTAIGGRLGEATRRELRKWLSPDSTSPPVGCVRWGHLRRTSPLGRNFGFDRGTPVDRIYIERFLERHADDVAGQVLEVQDSVYTRRYGGSKVVRADVLDIDEKNPRATLLVDLNDGSNLPTEVFDCIILTQTLLLIYEVRTALRELHRSLKPGGVLLLTVPGVASVSVRDFGPTWHWSFTASSMRRLLAEVFPDQHITVEARGNVLAAVAFLEGLAAEELRPDEIDAFDPEYPLVVTARAVKATR